MEQYMKRQRGQQDQIDHNDRSHDFTSDVSS